MALTDWSTSNYLGSSTPAISARPMMITCWGYPTWDTAGIRVAMAFGTVDSGDHIRVLRVDESTRVPHALERGTAATAASGGTMTKDAWSFIAAAFVTGDLRESWAGTTYDGNTDSASGFDSNDPTAMRIGVDMSTQDPWASAGALAEFAAWDVTGFSQQDREDLAAELSTLVEGEAPNPVDVSAQVGQPWSGALVWYVRAEDDSDLEDQVGSNDLTMTGTLTTFASHPPVASLEPPARLTPEHVSTRDADAQDPDAAAGSILVPVPSGIGTQPDEVVLVGLMSQQRLRHSMMTTIPTGFDDHVESDRPAEDAQDQPHILWYALADPTAAQPEEWEWVTSEAWEGGANLVQPTVIRYKRVDRTDPFGGGTPTWDRELSADTVATAPVATAGDEDSVRLVGAAARRSGDDWTFAAELTRRSPVEPDDNVLSGIGEEPVTDLTEMGTRDLGHTNLGTPGGYRWVAGSVFLLGAADDGSPGAPDHAGTEPVSWESALLVAKPNETHPNATDDIEVYRHTATMGGDPAANGTLIHTFSPGGSVVHATGWDPDETYFLQQRAVNAEGSTLGPEFQITTWSEAAHVLTDAQTMVVPMKVETGGVDIDDLELHGSNVDETSWSYTHPGGSLLVFVSARDPDGLATMDEVTWDGVAMTKVRGDASSPTDDGSRLFGGIFWMKDAPAGTLTLAASTSGGTPAQHRWHVYSLSGPDLAVRSTAWNGADPFGDVQINVPCEVGDHVFDHIAWTFSAVNVASIGDDQTQRLADDSPTRQNGTSALVTAETRSPGGTQPMFHTADDPAPSNVSAYWGVSISSSGGAATMKSLRVDVGLAALSDADLWHV